MSEPKILNIFRPFVFNGYEDYFNNDILYDGEPAPELYTSGLADDMFDLIAKFGDDANTLNYSGIIFINNNINSNDAIYGVNINDSVIGRPPGIVYAEKTDEYSRKTSAFYFPTIGSKLLAVGFGKTIPSDSEKKIGELVFFNEDIVALGRDFSGYSESYREKIKEIILGSGGIHQVITRSPTGKNLRYEADCQFQFMTEREVEDLRKLKEDGKPFHFQPESLSNPQNIYLCHWVGPFDVRYTSSYKGAGLTVNMKVKAVK